MACFTAPLVEAVIVSMVKKRIEKKENLNITVTEGISADKLQDTVPLSRKIGWLTKMLWGGSFLLAVEHIWHGELVPWPPFLTAINNPADIVPMLLEIATVGVAMSVFITAVWGVMVLVSNHIEKKAKKPAAARASAEV